jgi:curved DNA-binding protein CbpA
MAEAGQGGTEDLYERLGVSPDSSHAQIVAAYRRLCLLAHPDTCPDDPEAADRFRALTEAYEVLGDVRRRVSYDRHEARARLTRVRPTQVAVPAVVLITRIGERSRDLLRVGPVQVEGGDAHTSRALPPYIARLLNEWMKP